VRQSDKQSIADFIDLAVAVRLTTGFVLSDDDGTVRIFFHQVHDTNDRYIQTIEGVMENGSSIATMVYRSLGRCLW
jgi:hypothetical protein